MTYEERNAWSAIIAGTLAYIVFGRPIWKRTIDGTYDAMPDFSMWAWDVIWLIGGGVVFSIIVVILFQIAYAIVTRTEKPQFLTDERDHMISRQGTLITLIVSSFGFMLAVVFLAMGWSALMALNTILASMAVAGFASELYRVAVYRFGL